MGAGASTQLDLKDEMLSQQEVELLYGDQFDKYIFETLKDQDGLVRKSDLKNIIDVHMKLVSTTLTNASFAVFKHYSNDAGEMKSRQFCDMCRDAKVLKKLKFSSSDAAILYEKVLKSQQISTKVLQYHLFRKDMVPAMALKFEVDEDVILSKFGGVTLPHEEIFDDAAKQGDDSGDATEQQNLAATKLQSISRQKSASKELEEMKQMINTVAKGVDDSFFSHPVVGQQEDKILDVFCTYFVDGVATKYLLVKLLQKAKFLNQKRTIFDCKMAFAKAQLIAKSKSCYATGIIANKFFRFRVFREVLLPCLAERFVCSTEEILEALRRLESNNVPALSTLALHSQRTFIKEISKKGSNLRRSFDNTSAAAETAAVGEQ